MAIGSVQCLSMRGGWYGGSSRLNTVTKYHYGISEVMRVVISSGAFYHTSLAYYFANQCLQQYDYALRYYG